MGTLAEVTRNALPAGTEIPQGIDEELWGFAIGLARFYDREDKAIERGEIDMANAFFVQPGMCPTFWPFFGYGRDAEALAGWIEYARSHLDTIRGRWWKAIIARMLIGGEVVKPKTDAPRQPARRGGVHV